MKELTPKKQNSKSQKAKFVDSVTLLSEASLKEVWDNPSDDCYNDLNKEPEGRISWLPCGDEETEKRI